MRLIDIARQAHVSPATVSRALNQPEIVSAEALARIEAVMRAHHYVPAPASRRRGPQNLFFPQQRRSLPRTVANRCERLRTKAALYLAMKWQ